MSQRDTRSGTFVDSARIEVRGGHGGRGSRSMRHEPFTPRGGPNGGDGGRGGSVIVRATTESASLAGYERRRTWAAADGSAGAGGRKEGRRGEDVVLPVPPGTLVVDDATGALIADLDAEGAQVVAAAGGVGGRGNTHFATSTHQAPDIAEPGLPGEARTVRLELKLIADVGFVGAPNAGKSSLLAALSAARPKVGAYPFTTLDPELGVSETPAGIRVLLADIPGLLPGASRGVGLGLRFLRHVERTRILVYVADGADPEPWAALDAVRREVAEYSSELARRPSLTVLNKIDLEPARIAAESAPPKALAVSALTGDGLPGLMEAVVSALREAPPPRATPVPATVTRLRHLRRDEPVSVQRRPWGFELLGARVDRLVLRTDFDSAAALARFQVALDRMGASSALLEAGAEPGDTVRAGGVEFEYRP